MGTPVCVMVTRYSVQNGMLEQKVERRQIIDLISTIAISATLQQMLVNPNATMTGIDRGSMHYSHHKNFVLDLGV